MLRVAYGMVGFNHPVWLVYISIIYLKDMDIPDVKLVIVYDPLSSLTQLYQVRFDVVYK